MVGRETPRKVSAQGDRQVGEAECLLPAIGVLGSSGDIHLGAPSTRLPHFQLDVALRLLLLSSDPMSHEHLSWLEHTGGSRKKVGCLRLRCVARCMAQLSEPLWAGCGDADGQVYSLRGAARAGGRARDHA